MKNIAHTMRYPQETVNKRKHTRGMSLIEILIGMVIMSVAVLALFSLYNTGQKHFTNQEAHVDILNDSRLVLTMLVRDIKEAIQVEPGPVDVGGTNYSTSANCVVLKIPSVDVDGLIIDIENDFDYIVYVLNPSNTNELQKIVEGKDGVSFRLDSTRLLTRNIESLVLSFLDTDGVIVGNYADSVIVDIALTTLKKGVHRTYEETRNTRTKLRNKV